MTPERLAEIHGRYAKWPAGKLPTMHDGLTAISDATSLVGYIELLHEDLRMTREERDQAKKDCSEYRKTFGGLLLARDQELESLRGEGPIGA